MGFVSDGAKVSLGKGKVFLDRLVSGARTGERYVGTADALTITPTVETKDKQDFSVPAAPLLKRAVTKISADVSLTLGQWDKENLALALLGTSADMVQTSGSVVDEAIADVTPGLSYKLAKRKVSSVVVKEGVVVLVAGTDYDVADASVGLIYIREGGALIVGDDITVSYSYAAETVSKVTLASVGQPELFLRFIGDPTAGPVMELELWKVALVPDGELGFIADDYGAIKLKGGVLVDAVDHPTEPYGRLLQR